MGNGGKAENKPDWTFLRESHQLFLRYEDQQTNIKRKRGGVKLSGR